MEATPNYPEQAFVFFGQKRIRFDTYSRIDGAPLKFGVCGNTTMSSLHTVSGRQGGLRRSATGILPECSSRRGTQSVIRHVGG